MGGSVKKIIPIVAAVVIPVAAPAIASAVGLSAAIGATAASAVTGAALGAATSAATGGNIGTGALFGGIGGGVAGYAAPASAASSAAQSGATAATGGIDLGAVTARSGLDLGSSLASAPMTTTSGFALGGASQAGLSGAMDLSSITASPDFALDSTIGGAQSATTPTFQAAITPTTATSNAMASTAATPTAATSGGVLGGNLNAPPTMTSSTLGVNLQEPSFLDKLAAVPKAIANKFTDPNAMADIVLRAAGNLAGSAMASEGLSPDEMALVEAQTEELRRLQETNQNLFNEKLSQAQSLIGESKYFDPEYFGLQSARRAQLAGSRAKTAGLRGLTGSRRQAEARRYDLGTTRSTGTAFDTGYGQGVQGRLQTMQAGIGAMPGYMPSTSGEFGSLMNVYTGAEERRRREVAGNQTLFANMYEPLNATSRG